MPILFNANSPRNARRTKLVLLPDVSSVRETTPNNCERMPGLLLSFLPIPWHTKFIGRQCKFFAEEAVGVDLPQCQKCGRGLMVPLSDFGPRGASLEYKVWACINPPCGFTIRIDKGTVIYGVKVGESKRRPDDY